MDQKAIEMILKKQGDDANGEKKLKTKLFVFVKKYTEAQIR